ncbi:monocarboxylate transporter 7-like isoform X1 [Chiloscyllium plagiosum]|uniref:monocarboxylate transporter 7-like isoform X1 n=2 Tax=Chiloscyllium plagiosum TaxID=36176 RepID=UPI001CB7E05C|nr:monocarboxylate transporter 7-like isoform X1 [Chiloscyllium plagiosum]XP_043570758.1 monocarboxylate transporter 7-like isoform X1 [Chiloscyllium plagiosum]
MNTFMENTRGCTINVYTKTPDGGWGWIIAIAFFFIEVLTYGIMKSLGVFFYDLMAYFDVSNSRVSWILSISAFVMMFTAPLSTILSNHFGCRPVVMLGGLLVSMGMMAASFARSIVEMYIAIGVVSGVGFCLSFLPTVTILSQYFDKYRSLVMAVASTGECFAIFTFAPAFTLLKNHLGWKNCLLIIGALQLNIVVCGALLRPIVIRKIEKKKMNVAMETKYMLENEETCMSIESVDSGVESLSTSCDNLEHSKKCTTNETLKENLQMLPDRKLKSENQPKLLDFVILKNKSFIFYALFGLFASLGFFAPHLYVIPLSISLGIDDWAAYMLSAMAVTEVFGRFSIGCVLNKQPIRKIYIQLICVSLLSITLLCFPFAKCLWSLVTCSMLYGFMFGTVASTHIPMLAEDDVVGVEKMPSAIGIYIFIQSFSGLAGPPIGGWLVDVTGQNYGSAFFFCGIGLSLGAFFLALVRPSKKGFCLRKQPLEVDQQQTTQETLRSAVDVPEDFLDTDLKKPESLQDDLQNIA